MSNRIPAAVLAVAACFFLAAIPRPMSAQSTPLPRVIILTTGGTIASRTQGPMQAGAGLVEAVPELRRHAGIEVEEIFRVGSSRLTPEHWRQLAARVNALLRGSPDLAGIVITHGTDSMEETAFFLHLTVRDARPVVLTGSMRSADEVSADGPANLINAVRVAASADAVGKGVLVVLNEDIASARDVWKADNRRVHTFRPAGGGFLGAADPDRVVFYRAPLRPHTAASPFAVDGLDSLPHVELALDYTGNDGAAIDFLAGRRPAGLVVASFAGGRMSAGAQRAAEAAARAGLPVLVAARVPEGRITEFPAGGPLLVARDLSPYKARILLMLALTQTREPAEIQQILDRY